MIDFVLSIIIVALCVYFAFLEFNKVKNHFVVNKTVDIVIARYEESLNWLCHPRIREIILNPSIETTFYIYNKGETQIESLECYENSTTIHVMKLLNVGRCDHTYLYHIMNRYNDLADVTIFIPASVTLESKIGKFFFTLERAYKDIDTVFINEHPVMSKKSVVNAQKSFCLDKYESASPENRINNDTSMQLSKIRPFKEWYISADFAKQNGQLIDLNIVTYAGIFAISRKNIMKRPLESYQEIIKYVDGHQNPEAGHYIERSWGAIFHPIDSRRVFNSWEVIDHVFMNELNNIAKRKLT